MQNIRRVCSQNFAFGSHYAKNTVLIFYPTYFLPTLFLAMDSDSDDGLPTASHIVIVDAMMSTGLRLAGYTQERIQRATYAARQSAKYTSL